MSFHAAAANLAYFSLIARVKVTGTDAGEMVTARVALQAQFEKQFAGLDEILPPADLEYSDAVKELLAKWKPPEGLPN